MATQWMGMARVRVIGPTVSVRTPFAPRFARFQGFGLQPDPAEVEEARIWFRAFDDHSLPKGATTYSRSSGAGGQHVNKTESKATTVWPVSQLISGLPKLLQSQIRRSRYYTAGTDSLTFHAQTERRRASNLGENRAKLVEELRRIYHEVVPGETDPEDVKKHENNEKKFHERRILNKKHHSAKKQSRRGPQNE